ncbi:MAG: C-terminal helicase domain-containing protein [Legionella sp.]
MILLIVTPYNIQANYLQSILPQGARVGTVDKFQGQEAPVVIISMVTSSAEDLPRNIEFLYSKNRMNVAVSRAQCLAIVVANPNLMDVSCKTVDQMKLVNTFCWLNSYAEKVVLLT